MAASDGGPAMSRVLEGVARGERQPLAWLQDSAASRGEKLASAEFAKSLDELFVGHPSYQREAFHIPLAGNYGKTSKEVAQPGAEAVYLCGHSLGLQPRRTRELISEELDKWAKVGVEGHFTGERPWVAIDEFCKTKSAEVVGAKESEVAIMNGLTVNLHLLFVAFYKPQGKRCKIMYESDAFPSDFHAFESQAHFHGLDPKEVLVALKPREGESLLRQDDVLAAIEVAGDTLAILVIPTVQYYTGQYFDVPALTAAGHKVGAAVLAQCAHSAGNVNLRLHDWGVDGACWCSYKYLNSGPGSIAGFFIHERHHEKVAGMPKLAGWWGHKKDTRFDMAHVMHPCPGAAAFQLCNPPVLEMVSLLASLDVFVQPGMCLLRGRSLLLTCYLEQTLREELGSGDVGFVLITPSEVDRRGSMLCLKFDSDERCVAIFEEVAKRGVIIDYRKPAVLRVTPVPLYNSFTDIYRFGQALQAAVVATRAADNGAKRQKVA